MTIAGTYYYQPSAGTGNLLLSNPPFAMGNPRPSHLNDYLTYALHMDTNQPTPAEGLPELAEFHDLREKAPRYRDGGVGRELWIAQAAYRMGADAELEACCEWLEENDMLKRAHHDFRAARRPKPPSLREQALAILDDCSARIDAAHENTLRRALEALPE